MMISGQKKRMPIYTELLIRDLQIPENPIVLDVGCGTGLSAFTLMRRILGKGKCYGIDISEKMINLVTAKAADLAYANVEFRRGDPEELDFSVTERPIFNICSEIFCFLA